MKKITCIAALIIAPFLAQSQNAPLTNGTFDADISGWVGNNTTPTWNATEGNPGGAIEFQSTANNNRINTNPNVGPYDGPGDYILTYDAKGTDGAQIRSALFQGANINGNDETLTSTWQTFTFTFTALSNDQMNIRFFGRPNGVATPITVFVDNVTWVKAPCAGQQVIAETDGGGTNDITMPSGCYNTGDMVEFTATPACANFTFNEWVINGTPSGSMNPLSYTVGSVDATVTATFNAVTPTPDLNFDTTAELANWSGNGNATATAAADDLSVDITGNTPKITYNCAFAPTTWDINSVRIAYTNNTPNTVMRFKHSQIGSGDVYLDGVINPNASGTIVFELTNTSWVDKVPLIEILFRNAGNTDATSGNITIDFIEFFNNPALSVDEFTTSSDFSFYPNPASQTLTISNFEKINQISIFDITGKKVITKKGMTDKNLNISALNSGVYLVKIEDINNNTTTRKLVKK